jgi:hypothetical protein
MDKLENFVSKLKWLISINNNQLIFLLT